MARLTYKKLMALGRGKAIADPQFPGLRFINPDGRRVYGQYRVKDKAGKWHAIGLGRVLSEEELDALTPEPEGAAHATMTTDGHSVPVAIIDLGQMELERFRTLARAKLRLALAGQNPRGEMGAEGLTLSQALEKHLARTRRGKKKRPRTIEYYRWLANQYLADWMNTPLARLTGSLVAERHRQIEKKNGPYAANSAMRMLGAVWATAKKTVQKDLGDSPTDAVDFAEETPRRAAIPFEDLPQWFKCAAKLADEVRRDIYLLALLTGLRRSSLLPLRWEDLEGDVLMVREVKGGEAFRLPLSGAALAVLERRRAERGGNSPWLFPSETSKSGHVEEPRPREGEFKREDGTAIPFHMHSLRNTYADAATAAGVHPYEMKLLLNHKLPGGDVTASYVRGDLSSLREAQEGVTAVYRRYGLAKALPGAGGPG